MPSHTAKERKKKARTPLQERLGLPGIDPQGAGGKPVVFKDDIPVPIKEAAPKLLPLAQQQQIERQEQDILQQRTEVLPGIAGVTTPSPEDIRLDLLQAAGAGLTSIVPGAAAGAAAGGAAGLLGGPAAPVTVPVAAGIGAVVGGIGTFTNAFIGNLRTQQQDFIGREVFNIRKGESNLRIVVQNTNLGADVLSQRNALNDQLARIDQAHVNAKQEAIEGTKFLGKDGAKELERFEIFYAPGGFRDQIIVQFEQAVINPNPNKISLEVEQLE